MNPSLIKVLFVVTSHGQLGDTGKPTGYYLSEVSHPYYALADAGIRVDTASPKGGKAPMDGKNLEDAQNRRLLESTKDFAKLENTLKLSDVKASDYQAIFFAGGHGTMWDFADNADIQRLSREIYEKGGIVSAVCHGPAALVNIRLSNGKYLVDGKKLATFTNEEEADRGLTQVVPFLLESQLRARGAIPQKAANYQKSVVSDQRLITGQNPASAQGVGDALVDALKKL